MNSKTVKIHYFKIFSLTKINILKFAGETLWLSLEIMLPLSLHTHSLGIILESQICECRKLDLIFFPNPEIIRYLQLKRCWKYYIAS